MMGFGYGGMGFMWSLMMLGMVAFYVVLLIAAWRFMRAHESLAASLKELAEKLKTGP